MPPKLTKELITAAIEGFQSQKRRIDDRIAELRAMLSDESTGPTATPQAGPGKRRKFSAGARKRMREAQQRRWAKVRGEAESPAAPAPRAEKPKGRISEEGMKRIIAATKKRWRLQKARAKKAVKRTAPAKTQTGG